VWFILEFYMTRILTSTISRFECISGLIKVTDNNDAWWKLEIKLKFNNGEKLLTLESILKCYQFLKHNRCR
jgi:hypothetical protein